ncbi:MULTISPECIES: hypothetical protein [Streptomyces]|uniref:hypothetical protein n=1 Tax=Streptomyces TaxID=1883 RepID=UPI001603BE40|nr:hypothetical protein [Streptomyces murinus]MBA9050808.1 hypothetical protein [Streptomyces murinus]
MPKTKVFPVGDDGNTIEITRTITGFDFHIVDAEGESVATVIVPERNAWVLLTALGAGLND